MPNTWRTGIVLPDFIIQPYAVVLKCAFRVLEIMSKGKKWRKIVK